MQTFSFTAASAAEALEQIREHLGPEAVVLNVRPLPANGLSRIWQKPMIEVLAYKPEASAIETAPALDAVSGVIDQLRVARQEVASQPTRRVAQTRIYENEVPAPVPVEAPDTRTLSSGNWRVGEILQKSGFLPVNAQ